MSRLPKRVVPILLVLSLAFLAGADIECDFDDGEFEFNLPGRHHYHDYYYYEDYYYDDYFFDPFGCCWFW